MSLRHSHEIALYGLIPNDPQRDQEKPNKPHPFLELLGSNEIPLGNYRTSNDSGRCRGDADKPHNEGPLSAAQSLSDEHPIRRANVSFVASSVAGLVAPRQSREWTLTLKPSGSNLPPHRCARCPSRQRTVRKKHLSDRLPRVRPPICVMAMAALRPTSSSATALTAPHAALLVAVATTHHFSTTAMVSREIIPAFQDSVPRPHHVGVAPPTGEPPSTTTPRACRRVDPRSHWWQ